MTDPSFRPAARSHVGPPGGVDLASLNWAAPHASLPVQARVRLPGSKSLTNRYLVLAALAGEVLRLRRPLRSRDTLLMVAALQRLGARIDDIQGNDPSQPDWLVTPRAATTSQIRIDCGLAGTVMRFLPPMAALACGDVRFDGDDQARSRPMGPGLQALRDLGVAVAGDALPFTVRGRGRVPGGVVTLDASASSQFVSGLLLSGPRFDSGVTVRHDGPPIPSMPHLTMTVEVLRDAGVDVDDSRANHWHVEPSAVHALDAQVEPDLSNAAAFLAAAMVTGGRVEVPGWPQHTAQAGDRIRHLFAAMGGTVILSREGLVVTGPPSPDGLDIDLHEVGELAPVVAAVAAVASSPSWLRGIAHLRGHETDRLTALATEINRMGGRVEVLADGLHIVPAPLHGARLRTYADHRMAMAAAVLGLAVEGVILDDVTTTGKTMPDFAARWADMVAGSGSGCTAGSAGGAAAGRSSLGPVGA